MSAAGRGGAARWISLTALALAVVQLAVRAWVAFGGYFSLDDYVFYTRAGSSPLWDSSFLFQDYNGHLMPGSLGWVWLSTELAPLDFIPVATACLVLQALIDLAMFLVLRRLFGMRPAILVPFSVFLFTTLTLPGMVWWSAALNQLPQQLFMLLAILGHLRYARTGRRRDALLAPLSLAGGLAFSEKTVLILPLLFLISWLFLVGPVSARGLGETFARYRATWIAQGALVVCYLVFYAVNVDSPVRGGLSGLDIIGSYDIALRRTVLPALVGGPWRWEPLGTVDALADPHPIVQVLALVLVAAVVVYSLTLSRGAWRGWSVLLVATLVEVALLLATRVQVVGVENVAAEYRYFTDLGLVACLAVGFAFLSVTTPSRHSIPAVLDAPPLQTSLTPQLKELHQPTVAAVAVTGLVASSIASAATYRDRWSDNPGKGYFANAKRDLRGVDADDVVYDAAVPTRVVWQLLWPASLPSRLFAPLGVEVQGLSPGDSTTSLVDLGYDGDLRQSAITGYPAVDPPDACGWQLDGEPVEFDLDGKAFYWNWVVQLDYTTPSDARVELSAGRTTTEVLLPADQSRVFVAVEGEMESVELRALQGSPCITALVVGLPQPLEW